MALARNPVDWLRFEKLYMQCPGYVDKNASTAIRWAELGDVRSRPIAKIGVEATRFDQGFAARYIRDSVRLFTLAVIGDRMSMVQGDFV